MIAVATRLDYAAFLRAKATVASNDGFEVNADEINPVLKPHQAQIVEWAVRGGRRAIFAAFGVVGSQMAIAVGAPEGVRVDLPARSRVVAFGFDDRNIGVAAGPVGLRLVEQEHVFGAADAHLGRILALL